MHKPTMAARAAQNATITGRHSASPSTDLAARVTTVPGRPGCRIRRTKARMTKAQRDSAGRYSDWNKSASFWTDAAWSRTVTDGMGR